MQKYFTLTAGVLSWTLNQAKSWNICTLGHKPTRSVQPTFYFVYSLKMAPVKFDEPWAKQVWKT